MKTLRTAAAPVVGVLFACAALGGCAQGSGGPSQATLQPPPPAAAPKGPAIASAARPAAPRTRSTASPADGFRAKPVVVEQNITEHRYLKPLDVDEATFARQPAGRKAE